MFNFGWGEILLIGIVALIAIGPKELPTVLRSVGQMLAKVRRMANEFQGQFQEAIREADIADLKKQAEDVVNDVTKYDPLTETKNELDKTFTFPDPLADPAPQLPPPEGGVTDGAKLPDGVLPPVDIALPDAPAPLTEKDFAVTQVPEAAPAAADAEALPEPSRQGGAQNGNHGAKA
jgi:sec-independent protein translocase protein TatB